MGGRVGSITTEIIADGLVFNMDAANRASYVPDATTSYNTTDLSISGSLQDTGMYSSINEGTWVFDGIDDCIHFPDNDIFSFGNGTTDFPFSICCWVYCDDATRFRTLSKATEWLYGPFGDDKLGLILLDNNASNYIYRTTSTTISQNVWVSLISTYDGSGVNTGIKHYINGVEASGYTNGSAGSYTAMHNNSGILYMGRDSDFGNYFTNGNIANAQIYNRALSSTEVLHNYNALKL